MIEINNKVDCCGCNACGDSCPQASISYEIDKEGFWYPKVDINTCIDCHLCEMVCPMLNKSDFIVRYEVPKVYAAYNKNEEVRLDSTSGGVHSLMAQYIFAKGGYVGGAIYNTDHTVSHITSDDPSKLDEIRSSKYLQSKMVGQYKDVKDLLHLGKTVFYCGAPCQIQALYKYLRKDYDNLITADFICRGVNSPKVFISYINMLERQFGSKATGIKFKCKKWGWHNFSTRVIFANGKEYCKDRDHDLFLIGYLQSGIFSRPSCYECPFKGFPQKADITLADFWGIEHLDQNMDNDKGTSLVMINSDKGLRLFKNVSDNLIWKEFTMSDAKIGNKAIDSSMKQVSDNRDLFFDAIDKKPFEQVAKEFFPIRSSWQWFIYYAKVSIAKFFKK